MYCLGSYQSDFVMATASSGEFWLQVSGIYPSETWGVGYDCLLQNAHHFYHSGKAYESRHVLLAWLEGVPSLLFEIGRLQSVVWFDRWRDIGLSTGMVDFLKIIDLARRVLDSEHGADEKLLSFAEETYSIIHAHLNGKFRKEGMFVAVPLLPTLTARLSAKLIQEGFTQRPVEAQGQQEEELDPVSTAGAAMT